MVTIALTLVEQMIPLLKRYRVSRAGVFGSFARGEATPSSDLDLLVDLPEGASLFDLIGLEQDLSDVLGRPVDAHTYRSVNPALRAQIMSEEQRIL
tara:strand:+ start:91 stop:378 length:288 start_codon:yes stop_codon:yes gene_type:complete